MPSPHYSSPPSSSPLSSSPLSTRVACCALALAASLIAAAANAIEFGTASVLSAKGQRLKVMIPFAAAENELVSVTQFQVLSSESSPGTRAPDPTRFTLSMPMTSNVLMLQSEEAIEADTVHVVVGLAGRSDTDVRYELQLP